MKDQEAALQREGAVLLQQPNMNAQNAAAAFNAPKPYDQVPTTGTTVNQNLNSYGH